MSECAQCGMSITEGVDHQKTDDAVFCQPCFDKLTTELHHAVTAQSSEINYSMALVGGLWTTHNHPVWSDAVKAPHTVQEDLRLRLNRHRE